MTYSLLAHLFPRIQGSQEDVATYALSYMLTQSVPLNKAFTGFISEKLHLPLPSTLSYHCQDADPEYGRPDITGYDEGRLQVLLEAKFYAGLTQNQPEGYLKRLEGNGLVFICPQNRVASLSEKVKVSSNVEVISWNAVMGVLMRTAEEEDRSVLGDLQQLKGFIDRVESEAFVPFKPEDFGSQVARDMERYYQVVDEVYNQLKMYKERNPSTKGLKNTANWDGYAAYIVVNGLGISINLSRSLWKNPSCLDTPFWWKPKEVDENGKWVVSDQLKQIYSFYESKMIGEKDGWKYIALIPKPYQTLEEMGEDLAGQIIEGVERCLKLLGDE